MSGSYLLAKRLRESDNLSVTVPKNGPMGGWENTYLVNGGHRECHPDFIAKPIGPNPYGFLVCERKQYDELPVPNPGNYELEEVCQPEENKKRMYTQGYDLYNNERESMPRLTRLGGQPRDLPDRRYPYQAHYQGADYYRDCIKFRGIGDVEKINAYPGDFGYRENKYYYSAPPPVYDVTQGVQPYSLWRNEQLRMGTIDEEGITKFEDVHKFTNKNPVF